MFYMRQRSRLCPLGLHEPEEDWDLVGSRPQSLCSFPAPVPSQASCSWFKRPLGPMPAPGRAQSLAPCGEVRGRTRKLRAPTSIPMGVAAPPPSLVVEGDSTCPGMDRPESGTRAAIWCIQGFRLPPIQEEHGPASLSSPHAGVCGCQGPKAEMKV